MCRAAGCNTLPIFGAYHKRTFLKTRYNCDTLRFGGDVERNSFVRRVHQCMKDFMSRVDAVIQFAHAVFLSGSRDRHSEKSRDDQISIHSWIHPLEWFISFDVEF